MPPETRTHLEAVAEARRRELHKSQSKVGVWLTCAAALVVITAFASGAGDSPVGSALVLVAGLLAAGSFCAVGVYLVASVHETGRLDSAEYALKRLSEQGEALERALALAAADRGMALFLRSFRSEREGSSDEEIKSINLGAADMERNYNELSGSGGGGVVTAPPEAFEGPNVWTVQKSALEVVHCRLPTVLLENVRLSESKRSELERVGSVLVPVVSGDWWPVFTRLAERATLLVFFVENTSGEFRREMEFAVEARRSYIVICSSAISTGVSHSQDRLLRRLYDGAADVVTYQNAQNGSDEVRRALVEILPDGTRPT